MRCLIHQPNLFYLALREDRPRLRRHRLLLHPYQIRPLPKPGRVPPLEGLPRSRLPVRCRKGRPSGHAQDEGMPFHHARESREATGRCLVVGDAAPPARIRLAAVALSPSAMMSVFPAIRGDVPDCGRIPPASGDMRPLREWHRLLYRNMPHEDFKRLHFPRPRKGYRRMARPTAVLR